MSNNNILHINSLDFRYTGFSSVLKLHSDFQGSLVANDTVPLLFGIVVISFDLKGLSDIELKFKRFSDDLEDKEIHTEYLKGDTINTIVLKDMFFDSIAIDTGFDSDRISVYFSGKKLFTNTESILLQQFPNENDTPFVASGHSFSEEYKQKVDTNEQNISEIEIAQNTLVNDFPNVINKEINPNSENIAVSGSAVYNYVNNKCFKDVVGLSVLELKIQKCLSNLKIYGDNVDLVNEQIYLHKIAKNRDVYNDSYIQFKNSAGTLIAYIPLGVIANNVGKVDYKVNYYQDYNFEFTINWDLLDDNTAYVGSLAKMTIDPNKIYIKQAKPNTDLPVLNLENYTNKVFKRFDTVAYTDEEKSIRGAIIDVEIWGKNVNKTDAFYLERLGYDRLNTNDIYFYIKKSDGTLIAEYQKDKDNNDVGVTRYVVNEFLEGYNVAIAFNWDFVSAETDYIDGEVNTMLFDNDKIYINPIKKDIIDCDNKVIKKDDKVYIVSKWNHEYDVLITFNKCMFNDLMTFSGVYLVKNTETELIEQYDKVPHIILNNVDSDNIGPYIITGSNSWVGGNHGFEGEFVNLSQNYVAQSNTIDVIDGTKFVASGGWARTDANNGFLKFQYGGVVGNQLTGVTGLNVDLTALDQIQVYHKTAETETFEFYVNGKVLPNNVMLPADNLLVNVRNKIYDSTTLNFANGVMDIALYENVMYRVTKGNIEVIMEHEFAKDISITTYYGMQLLSEWWQQKVYQANSENTNIQAKANYPKSGNPFVYDSDKMIISKSNDIYNCAMWFDPNCGYAQNKANYLDAVHYLWNGEANGKYYHGTILKPSQFLQGQKEFWRGVYSFFANQSIKDDASYLYKMYKEDKEYLCADFHKIGNDNLEDIENVGKELETISNEDFIQASSIIMPKGLQLKSNANYGSILLEVKK